MNCFMTTFFLSYCFYLNPEHGMAKQYFITAILVLLLPSFPGSGQDAECCEPMFLVGARYNESFIIQHTKKLKDELTQSHPWILETEIGWHLRRKSVWNYCTCFPRAGFSMLYINFDLPEILGSSLAAYAFIEPFIKPGNRLNFSFRFGIGPAYLTKIYDPVSNPDNLFFGSRISYYVVFNAAAHYRLTNQLGLRLGANYNHISNAGASEPNLGMNFPSLNAGLEYTFSLPEFPVWDKSSVPDLYPRKNRFQVFAGAAAKAAEWKIDEHQYLVSLAGISYGRVIGRILALKTGFELVDDRSVKAQVISQNLTDSSGAHLDYRRAAVLLGVEWLFGRFTFSQQFGYYVYAPVEARHPFYQRYGLGFMITERISLELNIKAHAQDADFINLQAGFNF